MDRNGAPEVPAVRPVGGPETVFDLEHGAGRQCLVAALHRLRKVGGVHDAHPWRAVGGVGDLRVEPRVLVPAAVEYVVRPSASAVHTICGIASASWRYRSALSRRTASTVCSASSSVCRRSSALFSQSSTKTRDLRAEDLGLERLEDVVDGAGLVAAEDVRLVLRDRGDEDDRDRRRSLALLDHRRSLEPVEDRHLDVEQDHGEVGAREQDPERLLARARGDELVPERLQDRVERDEVLAPVVDEQDRGHQRDLEPGRAAELHEERRDLAEREHVRFGDRPESRPRHLAALGGLGILDDGGPAEGTTRASPCAPSSFAPVRTTPTQRSR